AGRPRREVAGAFVDREQLVPGDRGRARVLPALRSAVDLEMAADVDLAADDADRLHVAVRAPEPILGPRRRVERGEVAAAARAGHVHAVRVGGEPDHVVRGVSFHGRLFPVSPSMVPMWLAELPLIVVNEPPITIRGNPSRRIARTWPLTAGAHGRIAPDVVLTAAMFGRATPSTVPKPPPRN